MAIPARSRAPKHILGFRCIPCGKEHSSVFRYSCPDCDGNLETIYDYRLIKKKLSRRRLDESRDRSLWRYLPILPLAGGKPKLKPNVGWTPLYQSGRLGPELGLSRLYIKDDGRNPSASFKDRASAITLAWAMESGQDVVVAASTGNAAASTACLAAGTGIRTVLFVPQNAPQAKVAQLLIFGARVLAVRGSYDDSFELSLRATERYGWFSRNTGYNPFTREGKKTAAYEICEQLNWICPDFVFVPVGDGNILSGLWKGFKDFHSLGFIHRLPRLVAVQAEGSDAIQRAFASNGSITPCSGKTVAQSIAVKLPRDGDAALKALRESRGIALRVSDAEILAAVKVLARGEAVFAEPAGAASIAGVRKAAEKNLVKGSDRVVALVTGNGLKDFKDALKTLPGPTPVRNISDLESIARRIEP